LSGDKAAAKRELDEAMRLGPTDELTWLARGAARVGSDLPGALADFDAALVANPKSLAGLQNKSHVLGKLGRTDDAIRALDRLIELYPEYVPARAGRGVLYARLGKWEAAKTDADDALRRDRSPANVFQIAGIYALLSKHDPAYQAEAFRLLTTALRGGFGHEHVETDKDLDPLRGTPEFRRVVESVRALNVQPAGR
jgi:tetratricopeptide (TPR) repeat protein